MTPEQIDLWLKITTSLISIGALIVAFFANRRKAINERLEAGSKRMDALDTAVASLQVQIKNQPGKDDLHELQLEIKEIAGSIKEHRAMSEANRDMMQRTLASLERVEGYLLNKGDG